MKINAEGLALLKGFEGCKLQAYQDIVGVWTIGYGCTEGVSEGQEITQEQADEMLLQALSKFEDGVEDLLQVDVSSNRFSALVCFAYNLGLHSLAGSTLLKKLNAGDFLGAAAEFPKWDKAGGQVVPGLLRRRMAERELFLKA